jgi:hypothetical protein
LHPPFALLFLTVYNTATSFQGIRASNTTLAHSANNDDSMCSRLSK